MSPLIFIVAGVLVLLIIIGLIVFLVSRNSNDNSARKRLDEIVQSDVLVLEPDIDESSQNEQRGNSRLTEELEKRIEGRGFAGKLRTTLAQADLKLTVTEFLAVNFASVVLTAALAFLIYQGSPLTPAFVLGGAVLGFFAPRFYLSFRRGRRIKAFNDQLGDAISLMANGLRAGYSVLQAMHSVSEEMPDPIATEFGRVHREIGLGITQERALQNLLRRVPSDDMELLVTAINIQAEVGGNLAEILEIIGLVIRERVRIAGEVKTLTAQGMISGYVISFLPIILGLVLFAMNQEYLGRMVLPCDPENTVERCTQPCGWVMVGFGLILIGVGFTAIQKIVRIEV